VKQTCLSASAILARARGKVGGLASPPTPSNGWISLAAAVMHDPGLFGEKGICKTPIY
jgi:hypothetical protein